MSDNLVGTYVLPTQTAKEKYPPLAKITKPVKVTGYNPENPNFLSIEGFKARWHSRLFEGVAPPAPPKQSRALDVFL